MIILDTNVISACMRPTKHKAVIDWLNRQPIENLWTTTVTLFELRYGIEKLNPDDERKGGLDAAWQDFASVIFADRILPFDARAARASADLAATRQKARRSVDMRDTFIAGIVLSREATLATRNSRDFADAGIALIDPWTARKPSI